MVSLATDPTGAPSGLPDLPRSPSSPPAAPGTGADTLASLLQSSAVPVAILHARYGPLLELVRVIIGVVPRCDEYLEIWPPAFRTCNILVPSFLNLPFSLFGLGGPPVDVVGLGMYAASRAADCPYCSAHTCSFALRRGASTEKVAQVLSASGAPFTGQERATIAVARSLARVPSELRPAEREELATYFSPDESEWVVAGVAMMGFLNKLMDGLGVELEPTTAAEVSGVMGAIWRGRSAGRDLDLHAPSAPHPGPDTLWTKLRVLPLIPFALRTDRAWQRGMPGRWPDVGAELRKLTGHDFPLLSRLRHGRLVRSIGSMLRENLDASTSAVGLESKVLAGVVFASVVGDDALGHEVRALGRRQGFEASRLDEVARFAMDQGGEPPARGARDRAALLLAKAASPSPAVVDHGVVEACRQGGLSPASIVELVTWLAVLSMLHRLGSYYLADEPLP